MQSQFRWALVVILCGVFCLSATAMGKNCNPDTANFVLVKENNGIALYERWYSVNPSQQQREIKATFRVKSDSYAAAALIKDESKGKKWNKNTESYRIVKHSEDIWFGYIQYDLPWPVSNQDCVLEYSQNSCGQSLEISFKGTDHPSFPASKKIQRIAEINGKWIFTENENGTYVEYYITTTPSNTLPTWITDPIIRNNLIETLADFKNILETNR